MTYIDESFEPVIIPDEFIELCNLVECGDAHAQYELGIKYLIGEDVTQNKRQARDLLLKAAEQGHAEALQKLSEMAENGDWWLYNTIACIYLQQGDPNTALFYGEKSLELFNKNIHLTHFFPMVLIDIYEELGRYKDALKILNREYRRLKKKCDVFDVEGELYAEDDVYDFSDDIKDRIFDLLPYVRKKKEKAPPKPRKRKEVVHDDRQLMFDFMYES